MFVCLHTARFNFLWGLTIKRIVLCVHFGKAEPAYCRPQTSKLWPRMMLESYNILCNFSSHISMNYTENVTQLFVHAQTVDTRRSFPQLPSTWARGLYPFHCLRMHILCSYVSFLADESLAHATINQVCLWVP